MSLILTKPSGTAMVRGDAQSGLRTSGQACHGWIEAQRREEQFQAVGGSLAKGVNCSTVMPVKPRQLADHFSIKTQPWGRNHTHFSPKESSAKIVTEKERKKERDRSKGWPCECLVISDQEIGRVAWRSVEDGYQRKGEGYGERLEYPWRRPRPISSLPLSDLLMFYHVLDGLDDFNSGGKSKSKSRKGKEAAGVSGQVEADGANPTAVLPIQTDGTDVGTGLPLARINPTEEIGRVAWRSVEDGYQRKGEGYGERLEYP
ncbi:hypothetical protein Bca52824_017852 [Brassica carinata]|uniref:Uncharacterized protein n=1 Tax=Brassica carinata TaxID=52824 RepID=A0A8X7VPU5_BRACI|nr:hypothetical protein Bca52824_017852 [Brassica carinata]